jgi:hypothetical protein
VFQHPHPSTTDPFSTTLTVLTFIRWNVDNVRGYEKAGRCSFFNKVYFLPMIKRARSSENLASLLHGANKGPTGVNAPVGI